MRGGMGRSLAAALTAAFAAVSVPGHGSAQVSVFVGGGASLPLGSFADFNGEGAGDDGANPGWMAAAGLSVPLGPRGLAVGARGFFGRNDHDAPAGDETSLYGGTALGAFSYGGPEGIAPFVYGEVGLLARAYQSPSFPGLDETISSVAIGAGAGVKFPVGRIRGFVAGGYMQGLGENEETKLVGAAAGVQIPIGSVGGGGT